MLRRDQQVAPGQVITKCAGTDADRTHIRIDRQRLAAQNPRTDPAQRLQAAVTGHDPHAGNQILDCDRAMLGFDQRAADETGETAAIDEDAVMAQLIAVPVAGKADRNDGL